MSSEGLDEINLIKTEELKEVIEEDKCGQSDTKSTNLSQETGPEVEMYAAQSKNDSFCLMTPKIVLNMAVKEGENDENKMDNISPENPINLSMAKEVEHQITTEESKKLVAKREDINQKNISVEKPLNLSMTNKNLENHEKKKGGPLSVSQETDVEFKVIVEELIKEYSENNNKEDKQDENGIAEDISFNFSMSEDISYQVIAQQFKEVKKGEDPINLSMRNHINSHINVEELREKDLEPDEQDKDVNPINLSIGRNREMHILNLSDPLLPGEESWEKVDEGAGSHTVSSDIVMAKDHDNQGNDERSNVDAKSKEAQTINLKDMVAEVEEVRTCLLNCDNEFEVSDVKSQELNENAVTNNPIASSDKEAEKIETCLLNCDKEIEVADEESQKMEEEENKITSGNVMPKDHDSQGSDKKSNLGTNSKEDQISIPEEIVVQEKEQEICLLNYDNEFEVTDVEFQNKDGPDTENSIAVNHIVSQNSDERSTQNSNPKDTVPEAEKVETSLLNCDNDIEVTDEKSQKIDEDENTSARNHFVNTGNVMIENRDSPDSAETSNLDAETKEEPAGKPNHTVPEAEQVETCLLNCDSDMEVTDVKSPKKDEDENTLAGNHFVNTDNVMIKNCDSPDSAETSNLDAETKEEPAGKPNHTVPEAEQVETCLLNCDNGIEVTGAESSKKYDAGNEIVNSNNVINKDSPVSDETLEEQTKKPVGTMPEARKVETYLLNCDNEFEVANAESQKTHINPIAEDQAIPDTAEISNLEPNQKQNQSTDLNTEPNQTENSVSANKNVSTNSSFVPPNKKDIPKSTCTIQNKNATNTHGRNLWVSNIRLGTRAQKLKELFSKHAKVIGAKIVQTSSFSQQRWYGYVTMETRAAADLCIEKLNRIEFNQQVIRITKVRPEHNLPMKLQKKSESKTVDKKKSTPKSKSPVQKRKKQADSNNDDKEEHAERSSVKTNLSKFSGYRSSIKSHNYEKYRTEREQRQRQRNHEQAMREEEKHRRHMQRLKEFEKRCREEEILLEREREKVRIERDRLERQHAEILRLEREKLEQEKQELRRQKLRLEEATRPIKRTCYKREIDDRKRFDKKRRYDESSPRSPSSPEFPHKKPAPKIESKNSSAYKCDYPLPEKRHVVPDSSYIKRENDRHIRETVKREVSPPRSKDNRYVKNSRSRSPPPYRSYKDQRERKPVLDRLEVLNKKNMQSRDHRYPEIAVKEDNRYQGNSPWHGSNTASKSFSGITSASSPRETWGYNLHPIETRWGNNSSHVANSSSMSPSDIFSGGNANIPPGMIGQGLMFPQQSLVNNKYSVNRFDKFKSVNNSRKY